jgi:hypothetical protein
MAFEGEGPGGGGSKHEVISIIRRNPPTWAEMAFPLPSDFQVPHPSTDRGSKGRSIFAITGTFGGRPWACHLAVDEPASKTNNQNHEGTYRLVWPTQRRELGLVFSREGEAKPAGYLVGAG